MKLTIDRSATFVATAWDRLVASDPGLSRLLLATRVTIAVIVSALILTLLATFVNAPLTIVLFGSIVAMQAALVVTDAEPKITTLLVPLPGSVGVALGAFFASRGLLADVAFLAVLFGAVAIRAYGPRWTALGTIAMIAYFFALFIDATIAQLPALFAAVVVAAAGSYIARFTILPDRSAWIARRTVEAYEARIRRVIVSAYDVTRTPDIERLRRQLRTAVQRLNETATSIESRFGPEASEEIRIVYDAELAAEDLATATLRGGAADAPIPRNLRLALLALGRGRFARAERIARSTRLDENGIVRSRAIAGAIVGVCETVERVKTTAGALARSDAPWTIASAQQPAMRQAIQVTIAAAVAIAAGEALSPQRWYWAVLATYFVFLGTASSGETLARAWSRIAGTAFGALAGVLVGLVVRDNASVAVVALIACLFLGVYVLRVSHAMMMFFITASLALLYIVLGRFSDELLVIRLAETAIGAICGGAAAVFILPTRTDAVARDQAKATLEAVRSLTGASIARLIDPQTTADPLEAARVLEERVQAYVARARPAVSTATLFRRGRDLDRWSALLQSCSYYGRTLARAVDRASCRPSAEALAILAERDARIATKVDFAVGRIDGRTDAATISTPSLYDTRDELQPGDETMPLEIASEMLERIERVLARFADDGTASTVAHATLQA